MDPNETLRRIREFVALATPWSEYECDEIQQSFDDLDKWLSKGGFLPTEWVRENNG